MADTTTTAALKAQAGFYCAEMVIEETMAMVWRWSCRCGEGGIHTSRVAALRGALAHAEANP